MIARKKLIPIDIDAESQRITAQLNDLAEATQAHRSALLKDVHLLAAAAQGDRVVVSCDKALKGLCDLYLVEVHLEWLLVSPNDNDDQRQALMSRLLDMSKTQSKRK